jgi:hypothetical protein
LPGKPVRGVLLKRLKPRYAVKKRLYHRRVRTIAGSARELLDKCLLEVPSGLYQLIVYR